MPKKICEHLPTLTVLTLTAGYLRHNLSSHLETVCTDTRNNTWLRAALPKDDELLQYLTDIHSTWNTMSDESIETCKRDLKSLLDEKQHVLGMTCHDFLYIFTEDSCRHYFLSLTDPRCLYVYKGECDMHLARDARMSFIQDMVRIGL